MADSPDDLGDLNDLGDLERWAAEARAREAADARVRERWLRAQAEEGTSWRGVLVGLVEREADVTITTAAGRPATGRLTGVGSDFVTVSQPGGRVTLVALRAVAWLRPAPGATGPERGRVRADDRPPLAAGDEDEDLAAGPGAPVALIDVLAQAVAHRPRVSILALGGLVTGELRAAGVDVIAVDLAGSPANLAYVPLASIYEISFLDSG